MNFNPNSSMNSKQLIDSLTSHISLYHSSNPDIDPSPNPRSSILKWFSSLTVHQRQASITIVDSSFTQLVVRMLRKSQSQGHGFFIVLPDLLSDDLPTICFRKSHGLLSRIAESDYTERVVYESILLFSSKEGEHVSPRSCSERSLDTVSVCEEFVGNVDKFVAVMDAVSSGRFLRGEESELGSDWVELKWLKAKGYYNMEAFLVNRMEVALRLAWFNCSGGGGKKRGVTFKEKANAAGVAANVLWRKKGCVDWWDRLNSDVRRKMLISMLGKASKAMVLLL